MRRCFPLSGGTGPGLAADSRLAGGEAESGADLPVGVPDLRGLNDR